jgi:hypothetical membrane protein
MPSIRKATVLSGLIGVALILLGSVASALAYEGRTGEAYSPLNHFVSELGDRPYAPLAWTFNVGLFVGGLLITAFMLDVARSLRGWFGALFALLGLVTGLSGALIGVFPMGADLMTHFKVAMLFFNAGLVTTIAFALYLLLSRQARFPRRLALPGGITALSFFSLLYLVEPIMPEGQPPEDLPQFLEGLLWDRPPIWPTAIVEWIVVLTVLGWVVAVALTLRRAE